MRRFAVLTGLVLLCLLTSTVAASPVEATADGCLFFAYTDDLNGHYSMVADNATLVGQDLTVWSTCDDEFTVDVDGAPRWGGLNVVSFPIPLESTAITITSGNTTIMWSNCCREGIPSWKCRDSDTNPRKALMPEARSRCHSSRLWSLQSPCRPV